MKIGELAKLSRCPAVTIRYYEKIGLLPNTKRTASNYRIYDGNDIERLRFIRHCRNYGISVSDIALLLSVKDGKTQAPQEDIVQLLENHKKNIENQIETLNYMLEKLNGLLAEPAEISQKGNAVIETLSLPCPLCPDYGTQTKKQDGNP